MKRFGFFNSVNGDRKYLASDISEALDVATTTGIKQEEGVFEVTPHEDMTIKINPGSALVFGCFFSNDEDELIELDMADGELNRIDRIAIRYDRFDRSVDTVVLKGANALNPTPPTPLRNENQFDLVLADIYIRKATTEILASDITDMRESELCGYIGVKGAVSQLEFDRHLADYEKLLKGGDDYQATLQNGWTGNLTYSKNDLDQVWLRGKIYPGTINYGTVITKLPSELKPPYNHSFDVYQGGLMLPGIYVSTDGSVIIRRPASDPSGGLNNIGDVYINTVYNV